MKLKDFISLFFITIVSMNSSAAKDVDITYTLNINILGADVKIGQIKSNLKIDNNKYQLLFTLKSEKFVNFIAPIDANGNVYGKINNSILIPTNYEYNYIKKDKIKNTKIQFRKSNVVKSTTLPSFDKDKLSPISASSLDNVIDPITAIIYLGDYKLNNGCTLNYRIYDGKRRYDLNYTNSFDDNGYKICRLSRKKIGGFKLKDKKIDAFQPAEEIDTYYKKINDNYILDKIITRSKFSNIIINVSYN